MYSARHGTQWSAGKSIPIPREVPEGRLNTGPHNCFWLLPFLLYLLCFLCVLYFRLSPCSPAFLCAARRSRSLLVLSHWAKGAVMFRFCLSPLHLCLLYFLLFSVFSRSSLRSPPQAGLRGNAFVPARNFFICGQHQRRPPRIRRASSPLPPLLPLSPLPPGSALYSLNPWSTFATN